MGIIGTASHLEAREQAHERRVEILRGYLSTAVHVGRTCAAFVLAASERKAQADAQDRVRILQVEADAFRAWHAERLPKAIETLIETKQAIIDLGTAPITGGVPKPEEPPVGKGQTVEFESTCYCLSGTTASGLPVGPGIIAVDPDVIPLGTRVYVSGYGYATAADTGGAIKGRIIDVWLPTYQECIDWGRRMVTVTF